MTVIIYTHWILDCDCGNVEDIGDADPDPNEPCPVCGDDDVEIAQ